MDWQSRALPPEIINPLDICGSGVVLPDLLAGAGLFLLLPQASASGAADLGLPAAFQLGWFVDSNLP
jgi:hypothetical protein